MPHTAHVLCRSPRGIPWGCGAHSGVALCLQHAGRQGMSCVHRHCFRLFAVSPQAFSMRQACSEQQGVTSGCAPVADRVGCWSPGIWPQDTYWAAQPHAHYPADRRPLRRVPGPCALAGWQCCNLCSDIAAGGLYGSKPGPGHHRPVAPAQASQTVQRASMTPLGRGTLPRPSQPPWAWPSPATLRWPAADPLSEHCTPMAPWLLADGPRCITRLHAQARCATWRHQMSRALV